MKQLSLLLFCITSYFLHSQAPSCPNNQVYIHSGSSIYQQQVPLPGPSSVVMSNLPAGSGGLAVGPNFGFPAPNPTYWTTAGGTYWYYNGATWTNTGHSTGNGAAVNLGAGGGFMYNLVGGTGQIYVYNGTGPGTLLTTIAGFSGGGPYDVVCDAAGNFFILKNTAPQSLSMYGPNGVLKCTWNLANNPTSSAGGGFAIVNGTVYYHNGSFYAGNIVPGSSTISFTAQGSITSPSDFASCPIPIPTGSVIAPQGGTLSCSVSQLPLVAQINPNGSIAFSGTTVASSTLASCNYTWSGPGIIAGQGTATVTVNMPGVYSYTTCAGSGCPSYSITASYTVVGQGAVITPTLTAPTCIGSAGGQISVLPNTATNTIVWTGPGITSGQGTPTITINAAGLYSVSITNSVNACAGSASVVVNQTPTVNITASSATFCSMPYNGSPAAITVSASGASNYTWSASAALNFTSNSTAGPFTIPGSGNPAAGTYTLAVTGANGPCSNSATINVSVISNPTITVSPATASVCQGSSFSFTAGGAATYTWGPPAGLSTTSGSMVTATPSASSTYTAIGQTGGCYSLPQFATLNVQPNPTITLAASSPTMCYGSSVTFTANGASSYTWSPAGSLSSSTGANVVASPSANQTYTTVGTINTCTASAVISVSVIPLPNLSVSVVNDTICSGNQSNLSVVGANNFSWTPSSGLNSTTAPFVIANPSVTTTYYVTGNNGACTGTGSVTVYVIPQPNVTITTPGAFICLGSSVTISAGGAQNFNWSPAASLSSANGNVVVASPLVSTNYTIVGYNNLGAKTCSEILSYSIVVIPNAQANVSGGTAICLGEQAILNVSGGDTYTWMPSASIDNPVLPNVAVTPTATTVYTVSSSYSGNCPATGTVLVVVHPLPDVYAGRDTSYNLDENKFIYASGTGTLTWIAGDEILCHVCPESQVLTNHSNCYTIEAKNQYGCVRTDEMCVNITTDYGVYIPNSFTPNGDGLNDVFYVYGYSISNVHMMIFDRWGNKIFSSSDQTVGWPGTNKGADCPNDVYVYKIDYKGLDGKIYHKTGYVSINR